MVALEQAVGVVVDRLAGPGQQPGGRVLLAEDQVGVGLAALQGDADRHLADRAAGQRVGPGQGLRAQAARGCRRPGLGAPGGPASSEAFWAMRSSSTKNSWNSSTISIIRGQPHVGPGAAEAVQVLHALVAEQVAAALAAPRPAAPARSGRTRARSRWRSPGRAAGRAWRRS